MEFDLIVIGSGPGGYKAAITAAHLGARVALIERDQPGGTCLNQGCVPKKTLVYLAALMEDVNALNGHGLLGRVQGDFPAALAHKDEVVATIRKNFPVWLRRLGVRVFEGHGRLLAPHRVRVEGTGDEPVTLTGSRVILATGSRPRPLDACPTDGERIISSRDFMLTHQPLPGSMLFVGGGAIGCELGYLMNQFGAEVTIAEADERLLDRPGIPERASRMLEDKLDRLGVTVRKGITVAQTRREGDGVEVTFSDGSRQSFERVLVAIGREPLTDGLGLENAGIGPDQDGFIPVSEFAETETPDHYAIGDLTRGPMTANAALHDAKVAAINAVKGRRMKHNYRRVPVVVDSALEIAAVGLTEAQAEAAGFEADIARSGFAASAKARGRLDTEGFIEVVHDEETGQLLGGCIVGPEAGEQIHLLSAACHSPRGLWFFTDMNYSHPSWCEALEAAIDPYTSAFSKSGQDLFRPGIFASATDEP